MCLTLFEVYKSDIDRWVDRGIALGGWVTNVGWKFHQSYKLVRAKYYGSHLPAAGQLISSLVKVPPFCCKQCLALGGAKNKP